MRPDLFLPIFAYLKCILLILLIENPWVRHSFNSKEVNISDAMSTTLCINGGRKYRLVYYMRIKLRAMMNFLYILKTKKNWR